MKDSDDLLDEILTDIAQNKDKASSARLLNDVVVKIAKHKYEKEDYNPETDMNDVAAMAVAEQAINKKHGLNSQDKEVDAMFLAASKYTLKQHMAREYARLKKEDNVAVREDSGARPSDLTNKYNKEMARGKGVNVLAPEPLKETIVENTRAVLTGDQPMVFDLETAKKLFAVMNGGREPNPLEVEKMKVNAKLSEKMYAAHGSSVSRVTAEVNKAVKAPTFEEERGTTVSGRNLYPSKPGHGNHPKSGSMEL